MVGLAQVAFGFRGGIITIDTTEEAPNVYIEGVLDTSTDINLELLYFDTGSASYKPVVTFLLSQAIGDTGSVAPWGATEPAQLDPVRGDISFMNSGQLYDCDGNDYQSPTIPFNTQLTFIVEGWTGNATSLQAAEYTFGDKWGVTAPFTETLSDPNSPILANIANMPALNLSIPEPGTFVQAGLGLASLLALRRRK